MQAGFASAALQCTLRPSDQKGRRNIRLFLLRKAGMAADKTPKDKQEKTSRKSDKPKKASKKLKTIGKHAIEVRRSGVHGRGVYAVETIAKGARIIEYKGERISWEEAESRHPHNPDEPNHTFYFSLENGDAIDANYGGNRARWINHACEPNCEAREKKGQVFIHAKRKIAPGEELFYDYGLVIDLPLTKKLKKEFACHCGSPECRGTMLAPKD
jgi:SET domain-containing protein